MRAASALIIAVALSACSSDPSHGERDGAGGLPTEGKPGPGDGGGEAGAPAQAIEPYPRPEYALLSETGLYADIRADELADGISAFEPSFPLWTDAAEKRRWISLPRGVRIDTSDLDHWQFPVGTRFWKEFSVGGVRVETRLIERYGDSPKDYFMGAFVWRDDGSDAELRSDGEKDALGTAHDVPSQKQCLSCHNGEPGRILGFSALQLGRDDDSGGPTLEMLAAQNRLSAPPAEPIITPPGDTDTAAALGYLHGNCGHCHNLNGTAWPDTQMVLRLEVAEQEAEASELYRSVVAQPLQYFRDGEADLRVLPGDPEHSGILVRMRRRGPKEQMPPLGTELVDHAGVELVTRWVTALPAEAED